MNGITTDFITSGIKVLAQKSGDNTIVWQIDGNGNTVGFNYNGTPYFYIKNAQGDIIAIADISGNLVAKYTYDSWGKLISIKDSNDVDKTTDENFIGYVNPVRYRGYYYDSETGLYYLNARYYDPEVGRFINADETLAGGFNLFEYCLNNPVNLIDEERCVPHPPGHKFRTNDPWQVYWEAGEHVQNLTINDPFDVEYAFIVYKDNDELGDYYSYDIERGNPNTGSVNPTRLINNYLRTGKCPDRLLAHTHGKDPRDGVSNYNKYSKYDYILADKNKILLGLFPPDGTSQMYDGRSGNGTRISFLVPPNSATVPRDPFYDGMMGYFRRQKLRSIYSYPLDKTIP